MPGNAPARLSGPVINGTWNPVLFQNGLQCPGTATQVPADGKWLPIRPAYQATQMWCWLTVGQMVFEHFKIIPQGVSGYSQCGIMQTIYAGHAQLGGCARSCGACAMLGGGSSREVAGMLTDFPHRLSVMTRKDVPRLFATNTTVLKSAEMIAELEADRPVVVAVSPSNDPIATLRSLNPFLPAQHVALVVGYLVAKGKVWYRVNDPFPFQAVNVASPYELNGGIAQVNPNGASVAYWIREDALKSQLRWSESFLLRHDGNHHP